MSKFPTTEADVLVLANEMVSGLTNNPTVYPEPPVTPVNLGSLVTALVDAQNAITEAKAASEAATIAKLDALAAMAEAMKKDLRYAENTVDFDDEKLKLLGWSNHKAPVRPFLPGQPANLNAKIKDDFTIEFNWQRPVDGGNVGFYQLYRRILPDGNWKIVASCFDEYLLFKEQSRNCEMEFYIVAANKSGQSIPGNTVKVRI